MAPMIILPLLVAIVSFASHKYITKHKKKNKSITSIQFHDGKRYPAKPRSAFLTKEELETYHRDGFILVKNAIQDEELRDLASSAKRMEEDGRKYGGEYFASLSTQVWKHEASFARVAFESIFPTLSAQLLDEKVEDVDGGLGSIRLLKDGLFGFQTSTNDKGCGFHVDDAFFWPASHESTGVNFWLALSDMPASEGGGIAVVNQTLSEPMRKECMDVIFAKPFITCNMEELSPECHDRMLEGATTFDMKKGDVLIWDRWTFHRSNPFVVESDEVKLRYTIRYVPGSAKAEGVLHESQKIGEKFDGGYYPQVWPSALPSEVDEIQAGLERNTLKH